MSRRIERVNELLREEISALVLQDVRDPRLSTLVSVTGVVTSPDLRHARVYISVYGGADDEAASLAALRQAAGYLRRQLRDRLPWRTVPELDFAIDPALERGRRVDELLAELQAASPLPPAPGEQRE